MVKTEQERQQLKALMQMLIANMGSAWEDEDLLNFREAIDEELQRRRLQQYELQKSVQAWDNQLIRR